MKTIILLGAGAMIPFGGPSTKELTDLILCNKFCTRISECLVDKFQEQVNFESILACVEQLLEWKMVHEYYSDELISNELLEPAFLYKFSITAKDLHDIFCDAIDNIIERIRQYDLYESNEDVIKYNKSNLTEFLLKVYNDSELKVYTLNYDRLIPKLFKDKDFVYEGTYNSVYEYNYEKFLNRHFTYFNLHGSIYLDCINKFIVQFTDIPTNLRKNNLLQGGNPGEMKFFSPIITGYNKSQRALSVPFNFGFGAFMYDCNTCDRLLIIGYSFNDPHINSILKSFVDFKKTKIDIIDYSDDLSFPNSIPLKNIGVVSGNFTEKESGLFYNKEQNIHLYTKGLSVFLREGFPFL